ncbi:hypothetical protein Daus18300_011186 [Diaporthe australafricana]|uniref:Carbonic anhydrase n=1 Tax=Diaporthe australafricana TaxID=127596 RepID=A0ABR3W7M3_9PEZI
MTSEDLRPAASAEELLSRNILEQRVRENVKLIKDSPFVREELKARTKGLIYDIKTGVLTEFK